MIGNNPFYYQQTRKYLTAFGNVFNNIRMIKYNKSKTVELERILVPILYGPKEKYLYTMLEDPEKSKPVQITLPAMSFEIGGIAYDPSRKQNSIIQNSNEINGTTAYAQYMGVPYNLDFTLFIYARNSDDALQITEQIFPMFNPDYNLSVDFQTELGISRDIPLILNSVNQNIDYTGDFSKTRYILWTLDFTMKVNYYGPVSTSGLIRTVHANTYMDPSLSVGYITTMNLGTGSGDYGLESMVYQGISPDRATAAAIVIDWNKANTRLQVGGVQGSFHPNVAVQSMSSNASYILSTFDINPLKLVAQTITPDPIDALANSSYGYIETTVEFPDTMS